MNKIPINVFYLTKKWFCQQNDDPLKAEKVAFCNKTKNRSSFYIDLHFQWWTLALAICITLILAILTVSIQTSRAAAANPSDSLRYE